MKTWTELVGKYDPSYYVDDKYWVRDYAHGQVGVLWTFDTKEQAEENFLKWKEEYHGTTSPVGA